MQPNKSNNSTEPANGRPHNRANEPIRFLVFSASLRTGSLNTRLVLLAAQVIEKQGGVVDYAEMREFDSPSYNQDVELDNGFPPGAEGFRQRLLANDAFVISSPEYNASMPGLLKNAIDWVSRFRPQPFNERHALLMSASPSMVGGNRSLWSLRIPLEHLGARVFPICFRWPSHTRRSMQTVVSPMPCWRSGSRTTFLLSWIWWRPQKIIHA